MNARPILAALIAAAVSLSPAFSADEALPVPGTVEEARARLQHLRDQSGLVERWVDEHWEEAFPQRYPLLSRAPKGAEETAQSYGEREMQARIAAAELKTRLRAERREWIENERRAVLALEIREPLPVRLGPYDPDRGVFPLLLGYGWPTELVVKLKVPERQKQVFAIRFPPAVPAVFRVNEKGEVYLQSVDTGRLGAEAVVFVAPQAPQVIWHGFHQSWVTAVSYKPDGTQVVSGGGDGALCAWDAETATPLWRLPDVEMALSIAHGPVDAVLATGGADSMVRLRDAGTGKEVWRAQASGMVFSVAFSPDGRFVATGDDGGTLRVWNAERGQEVLRAELGGPVMSVAYTPDGRAIAAGSDAGFVILWEIATGRQLWKVPFDGPVYAVAVSAAKGLVAAGGGGADVRVLYASDGSEAWRRKSDGEVRAVRFDQSGRLLAFGGSGYAARVLLAETGEPRWTASIGSPVRSLAFGPQGRKLVVGSADFGVRLFAVEEGNRILAAFSAAGRVYMEKETANRLFR